MPTPINAVQIREIPQPEQTQTKNISYKANPNNTLVRVPNADTYISYNKKTKTILGIVGGAIATVAVVLGAVCYKKGAPKSGEQKNFIDRMKDDWKELIGRGKKATGDGKPEPEGTPKPEPEAKAEAVDEVSKTQKPAESTQMYANAAAKTPVLKPVEEIDGSDFSKLDGITDELGNKLIKDSDGNVVRKFITWNGKTLSVVIDYDPKTGNAIKSAGYREDGKTLYSVSDFDPKTGYIIKDTGFREDGKTLYGVSDFDPKTGYIIKDTGYREDGKTLNYVNDYNPKTGNKIKGTGYREDGKTLSWVSDYDPNTGNEIKQTGFREDGKKVLYVTEFDPKTAGKEVQTTYYKEDGTVNRVEVPKSSQ